MPMLWAKSSPRCNCYNFLGWSTTSLQTSQMNKKRSWLSTTQPFYFARTGINSIFIFSILRWKILMKFFWESVEKSQGTASEHPNYICLWPALTFERLGAQRKGKCCSQTYEYASVVRLIFLVCHGCSNLSFLHFRNVLYGQMIIILSICYFQINPGLSVPSIYNFHLFPAQDVLAPLYSHELQLVGCR